MAFGWHDNCSMITYLPTKHIHQNYVYQEKKKYS